MSSTDDRKLTGPEKRALLKAKILAEERERLLANKAAQNNRRLAAIERALAQMQAALPSDTETEDLLDQINLETAEAEARLDLAPQKHNTDPQNPNQTPTTPSRTISDLESL